MHLKKLCVGVESVEELALLQKNRRALGEVVCAYTTNKPKVADDVIEKGSLYWIIKGAIRARQKVIGFGTWVDGNGKERATILLDAEVIATESYPHRPFQGWRYLKDGDVPSDIDSTQESDPLLRDLRDLGVL